MGWNEFECRKLVGEYQQAGILERHEVANPNNPDRPVAAVKLVRTNETVRRALGSRSGLRISDVFLVSDSALPASSRNAKYRKKASAGCNRWTNALRRRAWREGKN